MAKLHFYYAAMNAGKTTTLLQSSYNYQERGMSTILFTPLIDTRVKEGLIASRIGLSSSACTFDEHTDLLAHVRKVKENDPLLRCVFVDEAQFLNKAQVLALTEIVDHLNIPVLAYGLRTDFRGEPFEGSLYLLAWAEELNEIKTICHCGHKATMNLRIDAQGKAVKEGEQIEIGDNNRYLSVCRKHYQEMMR